eukprot:1481616-Prymnesium_polylepis.2
MRQTLLIVPDRTCDRRRLHDASAWKRTCTCSATSMFGRSRPSDQCNIASTLCTLVHVQSVSSPSSFQYRRPDRPQRSRVPSQSKVPWQPLAIQAWAAPCCSLSLTPARRRNWAASAQQKASTCALTFCERVPGVACNPATLWRCPRSPGEAATSGWCHASHPLRSGASSRAGVPSPCNA